MRSAIISLAVISVALAASSVPAPAQQRIVGGRPTTVNKYPFIANIQVDAFGIVSSATCGGSLISATAVLTAAHCVAFPASFYSVRLGSSDPFSGGTVYNVASYVVHPDWTGLDEGDVAILKLARPVIFSDVIRAARIPASVYPIADGTELTAIGWGDLYAGGPAPEILQEVQLNKVNTSVCAERYTALNATLTSPLPTVTDRMICAGTDAGGKGPCNRDSGGPLILNDDIVVGVVSWGYCPDTSYPGVHSLVSAYTASVPAPAQQRIVGGRPTTVNKYPFAGNIQINEFGIVWDSACGGSLISATAVLSAAHCFGFPARSYGVRLGSSSAISGGTVYNVASYVRHPEYTNLVENDVAILKLARPAIFSDVVRAASIPARVYPIADGTELTAIGWGILISGGTKPEILQEVQFNKVNTAVCAERYRALHANTTLENRKVTDRMLCAGGDGGKATCSGDSGGPILINGDIVVGIVSWGHPNCFEPMYPSVNSLVSAFSDWIVENAS
ncbi:unnamed protein product [Plutella xylostella]|uniref:(diamondback moth) hypothetical protein n=1 Tax=Plutella xylostella TaxID=51655 RepID=A0A8S4FQN1_PLUXY|nr:unnamed protein product [Plutella xylostella]